MREAGWGKEPFDLRLTILRLICSLPQTIGITILGILVLWGGYYLKNVVLDSKKTYDASATFFIDYADEEWYVNARYFNDYTWNIWLKSDQFLNAVEGYLADGRSTDEDLQNAFTAEVPADLRVVVIRSISSDPDVADARIEALKKTLQQDFPTFVDEIGEIRVVDEERAALKIKDLRFGRAFLLATVVSLLFSVTFFLIRELTQEKIWLPTTLTDKFGLRNLGIPGTKAYKENVKWILAGKKEIAICGAEERLELTEVVKEMEGILGGNVTFRTVSCPLLKPEGLSALRTADGVILAVRAGGMDAKNLELLLSFLEQQDCKVTAATIWKENRWLLRRYYHVKE